MTEQNLKRFIAFVDCVEEIFSVEDVDLMDLGQKRKELSRIVTKGLVVFVYSTRAG